MLGNLIGALGAFDLGEQGTQSLSPLQEARFALRRENSMQLETAYNAAMGQVGNELTYAGTRHAIAATYGIGDDVVYTLWDPIKNILQSEEVQKEIKGELEKKYGKSIEDKDLVDLIVDSIGE
jgi:hypothetical protein